MCLLEIYAYADRFVWNMTMLRGRFGVTNLNKKTPTIELRMTNQSLYNLAKRKEIRVTVSINKSLRKVIIQEDNNGVSFHLSHSGSTYLVSINPLSLKKFLRPNLYNRIVSLARSKALDSPSVTISINVEVPDSWNVQLHDGDAWKVARYLENARCGPSQTEDIDVIWGNVGIQISRTVVGTYSAWDNSRGKLLTMEASLSAAIEAGRISQGCIVVPESAERLINSQRTQKLLKQIKHFNRIIMILAKTDDSNKFLDHERVAKKIIKDLSNKPF